MREWKPIKVPYFLYRSPTLKCWIRKNIIQYINFKNLFSVSVNIRLSTNSSVVSLLFPIILRRRIAFNFNFRFKVLTRKFSLWTFVMIKWFIQICQHFLGERMSLDWMGSTFWKRKVAENSNFLSICSNGLENAFGQSHQTGCAS